MSLALIVGMCFLLPWAQAAPSVGAAMLSQPQDKPAANSSSGSPASPSQPNQQKGSDQSTAQQQPPAAAVPPCPESSGSGAQPKSDCKSAQAAGTKTKKHHRPAKSDAPSANPEKADSQTKVVKNGSEPDPATTLAPSVNREQASRQAESTKQLLDSSDANLKKIKISGRKLTASEQETAAQIQSYMDQAKKATEDGDAQRAYNLAVKANLLSAELAKH